jgi:hypothetical protein
MSSSARSPNPFFSVWTISIFAYPRRWNLAKRQKGAKQFEEPPPTHRWFIQKVPVTGKTLYLRQAIDAILNYICETLSTLPLAQRR